MAMIDDVVKVLAGRAVPRGGQPRQLRAGTPATWTILQQHGPNHLGLRCNALPEHQIAVITSGCVPFRYTSTTSAVTPKLLCLRLSLLPLLCCVHQVVELAL